MSEEIFIKGGKDTKKKLTDKQLAALAKGRARMEEKRKQKKLTEKTEKEYIEVKKTQRETRKKTLEEQAILEKIKIRQQEEKKRAMREESINKWERIRLKALDKCQTVEQYEKVAEYLDKFDDDDIVDENKIKDKYNKLFSGVIKK